MLDNIQSVTDIHHATRCHCYSCYTINVHMGASHCVIRTSICRLVDDYWVDWCTTGARRTIRRTMGNLTAHSDHLHALIPITRPNITSPPNRNTAPTCHCPFNPVASTMPPAFNPDATSPQTLRMRAYRARLKAQRPAGYIDGRTARSLRLQAERLALNPNALLMADMRQRDRERKRAERGSLRTGSARRYVRKDSGNTGDPDTLQDSSGHSE